MRLKKDLVGPPWLRSVDIVEQVSWKIPFFAVPADASPPYFMNLNTNLAGRSSPLES